MTQYKKFPLSRPCYKKVDSEDREALLKSRSNALNKSFVTDVWVKVIFRAIDDIILYRSMRMTGKQLSEEEKIFESSAYDFLFNDDHVIAVDDYLVELTCFKCKGMWQTHMSDLAGCGKKVICPECNFKNSRKRLGCSIIPSQIIVETSLKELLDTFWGDYDIKGFRNGCRRMVNEAIPKRVKVLDKRRAK